MSFVILVAPPFLSSMRPSMGLSALQGELRARDVRCETRYENLDFAARVGLRLYEWFVSSPNNLLLGEWVFSHLIRGGTPETRNDGWADVAHSSMAAYYSVGPDAIRRARSLAGAFVDDTARSIVAARPGVVGFSTTFQQNCAALAIAARIKELAPDIIVCFGGANCARPMGEALLELFPQIDYVFSGEADVAFPDLVARLDHERPPRQVIDCEPVADLDALAMPVMDDFVAAFAAAGIDHIVWPVLVFESSRGCWWGVKNHCRFCGINDETIPYRRKSPERVAAELRELAARHGIPVFAAVDNILASGKAGSQLLAAIARIDPPLRLFYEVKANTRREQLVEMARAGVTRLQPGIESLDDDLLSLLRKGVSALQNVVFLRNCREIGIVPAWNVLYQIPGESLRSYDFMAAIIPFLEHLPPPMRESRIRLDRFSPFFERAAEYGYSSSPFPGYEQVYGLGEQQVTKLASFFRSDAHDVLPEEAMTPIRKALEAWRDRYQNGKTLLAMVSAGDGAMIVDTRAVAKTRFTSIDATAVQILEAFRSPVAIDEVAARFGRERIEALIDAGYIIASRDGRRAVTVVCDPSERIVRESEVLRGGSYVFKAGLPLIEAERPLQFKVDLFAALWVCGDDEPTTANPQLLPLLRDFDPLHSHEARAALDRIRHRITRDALIKMITRHTCGQEIDADPETLAFIEALNDLDDVYGAQFARRLTLQRAAMREAVGKLTAGIDAVTDLAAVTGSPCELDIVFCPSLFLPPPQAGRHGTTVRDDGRTVAFLYFGFPLAEDLSRFGLNRGFFHGGAQSYAIRVWFEPHWQRLSEDLAARTALRDAMIPHLRPGERWPDLVRANLGMALRGKLAEREGLPRAIFRRGVVGGRAPLFDWFIDWLDSAGTPLEAALPLLPDALERDAAALVAALEHRPRPDAINIALAGCTEPPTLVVPDTWGEGMVDMATRSWSVVRAVTLRVSQWMISERAIHAPVVAVGNARDNPVVASVLRRRPVEVPPNVRTPIVFSLYDSGDGPWTIAIAADEPEVAASIGFEIAAKVNSACAVLDAAQ